MTEQEELIKLRKDNATLKRMLSSLDPSLGGPFICGVSYANDTDFVPESISVCPTLGLDYFYQYKRAPVA